MRPYPSFVVAIARENRSRDLVSCCGELAKRLRASEPQLSRRYSASGCAPRKGAVIA